VKKILLMRQLALAMTPPRNLQYVIPPPLGARDSTLTVASTLSTITNPSAVIKPSSRQILLSVEIQQQRGKDHLDVTFAETK
jgi:hypothetical protein